MTTCIHRLEGRTAPLLVALTLAIGLAGCAVQPSLNEPVLEPPALRLLQDPVWGHVAVEKPAVAAVRPVRREARESGAIRLNNVLIPLRLLGEPPVRPAHQTPAEPEVSPR